MAITSSEHTTERIAEAYIAAVGDGDRAAWEAVLAEYGDMPITLAWLDVLVLRVLADSNQRNIERNAKDAALFQRVEALERRRALKYIGVWQRGHSFADQEVVSFQGSMWTAVRDTCEMPGGPDSGWILSCKSGRDGKPGKDGQDLR